MLGAHAPDCEPVGGVLQADFIRLHVGGRWLCVAGEGVELGERGDVLLATGCCLASDDVDQRCKLDDRATHGLGSRSWCGLSSSYRDDSASAMIV
jgi:hypothetical protein